MLGAALDPLDAPEKVEMKRAYLEALGRGALQRGHHRDPYDLLSPRLKREFPSLLETAGKLEVEDWLRPRPSPASRFKVKRDNFTAFLDAGGCEDYSKRLGDFIAREILPGTPLLIGVDHSLTGGALRALSEAHGAENLGVIVLDAHSDIIPLAKRLELYEWMRERGKTEGIARDFSSLETAALPDSYNCGSFIHHLLEEGVLRGERLLLVGVADRPAPEALRSSADPHNPALRLFRELEDEGVGFVGRDSLRTGEGLERLRELLRPLEGKNIYVSVDIDVGALRAVGACRFMDLFGLEESELFRLVSLLGEWLGEERARLVGMDLMEMDIHLEGIRHRDGTRDRTSQVALRLLSAILSRLR